ncbi:MAG TPA: thiol peroxidase [Sedimentisphaerales bacterium]|nr:thiol peroxidase [Sedimentisphaerales bacterium]
MVERTNIVTFQGNPLTLIGDEIKVGDKLPDCQLVGNDLSRVQLSSFKGKLCIISCVPSLDTPVCDLQTRRFNEEAGKFGENVAVITVSMDLPFAQQRWCGNASAENIITLSDYMTAGLAKSLGVLIKELHLFARAVFVVDKQGVITYVQIVREVTNEPDYEEVLKALRNCYEKIG